MIKRTLTREIMLGLDYFPVTGIIGPRQVGKTTLAKQLLLEIPRPSVYLDLELDADLALLQQNAQGFLQLHQDKCVVIDEIQHMPRLFSLLRALVDQHRVPARFMILGSASPTLIRQSAQSLAGRIAYSELTPLSLLEVEPEGISQNEHWFKGGFPNALLQHNPEVSTMWLRNFVSTFIEKDLKSLGYEISLVTMTKLYRMIAHVHGQLLNMSSISLSLGVSQPTVSKYLDLLEGGFLIHRLEPYFVNVGKRLVKSPKIYFRDTGILHQLADITSFDNLQRSTLLGASWEGYVVEQIRRVTDGIWQYYFYRTVVGAEVDLFLISPNGKKVCIEIKYSVAPSISKGFYMSVADLKPDFQYVIIPTGETYFRDENVKVCSLINFLKEELAIIIA